MHKFQLSTIFCKKFCKDFKDFQTFIIFLNLNRIAQKATKYFKQIFFPIKSKR